MFRSILDSDRGLPRSIPLFRHLPTRSFLQLAGEVPQRAARESGDIGEAAEAECLLATAERAGVEAAIWHAAMAEGGKGPSVH